MPRTHTTRRTLIPALATLALALTPAAAQANSWFGSSLDHTPANAGSTCTQDGIGTNPLAACTHVGSDYPGFSGHAQAKHNGTITQLKLRPEAPMTFTAEVVNVRNQATDFRTGQAQATQRSRQITIQGPTTDQAENSDYPIVTVPVHMTVKKGQEIAINTTSNTAEYCSDGTPGQLLYQPILAPSKPFQNSAGVDDCLMLIQAIVH
jgi:hypothetical protein